MFFIGYVNFLFFEFSVICFSGIQLNGDLILNSSHLSCFFLITGGGEKARARHISRGKLLPRERIDNLLDPGLVYTQVLAQDVLCSMVLSFFLFFVFFFSLLAVLCSSRDIGSPTKE